MKRTLLMEMRIYIANLGKYNEGELVGAWFLPPISMEEVAEKIGLNETYEEYAIHDYELPFDIGEYESIDEINRLCEMAEEAGTVSEEASGKENDSVSVSLAVKYLDEDTKMIQIFQYDLVLTKEITG